MKNTLYQSCLSDRAVGGYSLRRSVTYGYENQAFQASACVTHFGIVKNYKY
ncbi:MAG: hypothetical protein LBQ84_00105 [Flavobacteriaceae bacterium]|nr:hypothetical protein [Flavobacteriaceae bacterium]